MKPRRVLVGLLFSLAIVGLTFAYALPKLAAYGAVWQELRSLGWRWLLALALLTALNVVTFAPPWMIALPGLGLWRALKMTQASTAFGLVVPGGAPLGMAASFAMLRSVGFPSSRVGLAVALTGIWNQVSIFLFPVMAVALLATQGTTSSTLRLAAAFGVALSLAIVAILVAALWRPERSRRLGDRGARAATFVRRLFHRGPVGWDGKALVRYRAEMLGLVQRSWPALTLATFANQFTGYLMLEASVRSVGIGTADVSLIDTFAAWSVARVLTSLPLTPGGIGVVELGLTGMLVGFGARDAPVVASVLVYRGLSILPTVALGLLATATWRRRR